MVGCPVVDDDVVPVVSLVSVVSVLPVEVTKVGSGPEEEGVGVNVVVVVEPEEAGKAHEARSITGRTERIHPI